MRTQANWEEQQNNLEAARLLAVFLNLEPSEFSEFNKEHWDFVPLLALSSPKRFQTQLKNVWKNRFCQKEVLEVLSSNDMMGSGRVTTTVEDDQGGLRTKTQTLTGYQQGLTYKKAILFLFTNSWRAKTCLFCGRRFIAEHPKAKFCGFDVTVDDNFNITPNGIRMSCFWAYRNRSKHRWWAKHSEGVNKRRKQEYRREKRNRRSHAKRKNLRQR
jgi:hypothetical protein